MCQFLKDGIILHRSSMFFALKAQISVSPEKTPGYETILLDNESDRSKICLSFPFRGEREVGKQKYEIAQSQSRGNTLSKYVDIVLHSIYFNDNWYVE